MTGWQSPFLKDLLAKARADGQVRRLDRILSHFYAPNTWHRAPPRGSLAGLLRYSLWLRLYTYSLKSDWRYWRYADWQVLPLPDRLF